MAKPSKYYQTSEFKKLNAKWSKKLEKSGFEDIEQPADFKSGAPDGNLKKWSASFFSNPSRFDAAKYEAKEEYYRLAGQFLHEHRFSHRDEKALWEMHSEGLSIDSIVSMFKAKKIEYTMGRKINRRFTHETILRLVAIMTRNLK